MITSTQYKNINDYVIGFLNAYGGEQEAIESMVNNWNSDDVQNLLSESIGAKTKKNGKKAKVKGQPKKNKSAYLFFCDRYRSEIKEENPSLKTSEITSKLGEAWKEIKGDGERGDEMKEYEEKAAQDKIRYEDEKRNFVPPSPSALKEEKKEKKKKKSSGPKRNKSAYLFFCQFMRPGVKEQLGNEGKPKNVTQELGKQWNELKGDEERTEEYEKYVNLAAEDKERYNRECDELTPKDLSSEDESVNSSGSEKSTTSSKKSKKVKVPAAKKNKKKGGYVVYCKKHRASVKAANKGLKAAEVTAKLAEMWGELDDEEKKKWEDGMADDA